MCVYVLHNDKKFKSTCLMNFCILLILWHVCETVYLCVRIGAMYAR